MDDRTASAAAITGSSSSSSSTAPAPTSGKDKGAAVVAPADHAQDICGLPADIDGLFLRVGRHGASKYAGVGWAGGRKNKWVAQGKHNCYNEHLGYYTDEKEAARAWTNWKRNLLGMPRLGPPGEGGSSKQDAQVSERAANGDGDAPKGQEADSRRNHANSAPVESGAGLSSAELAQESASGDLQDAKKAVEEPAEKTATATEAAEPAEKKARLEPSAGPAGKKATTTEAAEPAGGSADAAAGAAEPATKSLAEKLPQREPQRADDISTASTEVCPESQDAGCTSKASEERSHNVEALNGVESKQLATSDGLVGGSAAASQPLADEWQDDMFDLLLKEAAAFQEEEQKGKKKKKEKKEKKEKKHKDKKKEKKASRHREELQEMDEDATALTGSSAAASSSDPIKNGKQASSRKRPRNRFKLDKDGLFFNDRSIANQTSHYMGVSKSANGEMWVAGGKFNGVQEYLGTFQDEKEAAAAYKIWKLAKLQKHGIDPVFEEVDAADLQQESGKSAKPTNGAKQTSMGAKPSVVEDTGKHSRQANGTQCTAKKTVEAVSKDAKPVEMEKAGKHSGQEDGTKGIAANADADPSVASDADEFGEDSSDDAKREDIDDEQGSDSDINSDSSSSSSSPAQLSASAGSAAAAGDVAGVHAGLRVLTYRDAVEWREAQRAAFSRVVKRSSHPQVSKAQHLPIQAGRPAPATPWPAPATPSRPASATPAPLGASASAAGAEALHLPILAGRPAPGTPFPAPAKPWPAPAAPLRPAPATPGASGSAVGAETGHSLPMSASAAMPAMLQSALGASAATSSASSAARDWMPSQALHPSIPAGRPAPGTPGRAAPGTPGRPAPGTPSRRAPATPSITSSSGMLVDEDDAYDSIAETQAFSSIQQELETLLEKQRQGRPHEDTAEFLDPESKRRKDEWEAMRYIEPGTYLTGPVSEEEEIARQEEFELNRLWEQEMSLAHRENEQQQQRQERLRRKRKALAQAVALPASAQTLGPAQGNELSGNACAAREAAPLHGGG